MMKANTAPATTPGPDDRQRDLEEHARPAGAEVARGFLDAVVELGKAGHDQAHDERRDQDDMRGDQAGESCR